MRRFIFGTDWGGDCDDVVAMRVLLRAYSQGKIDVAGIIVNHCLNDSAASVDGFLRKEGHSGIPIGLDASATFEARPTYQPGLSKFAEEYKCNSDADDAVRLYRKILANSEEKVEIIEVGFLQAVAGLLKSDADDISDKTGIELVSEKVRKFWVMAGRWDEESGWEYNFACNQVTSRASSEFCALCPVPVTFLGFEVGVDVITGSKLSENDHLYKVLGDCGYASIGRSSWDPMTTALAIEGDELKAGYDVVEGTARVDAETGRNYFTKCDGGKHKYVVMKKPIEYYRDLIDEIIKSDI